MNEITFGGYPITFTLTEDNDVLIECKGLIGTLSQIETYLSGKEKLYYFGDSKVRHYPNRMIRIDCLIDEIEKVHLIYEQAQIFKNGNGTS